MNVFQAVKQSVTTRQVAEHYGFRVDRSGKVRCPFHNDRTPSMKVDHRFHCFGCGADGDAIDFVSKLYAMDAKSAAEKLAADFLNGCDYWNAPPVVMQKSKEQMLREQKDRDFNALILYYRLLRQWEGKYAPQPEDEEWHPLFVEALQNRSRIAFLLDELLHGDWEAVQDDYREEVIRIEQRVSDFADDQ